MPNNDLLREKFPLPGGVKLRKPRFGTVGPSPAQAVPSGADKADTRHGHVRERFRLDWEDPGLGLRVMVVEQENGELVAHVVSDSELPGQAVSVALVGSNEGRMLRKNVLLDKSERPGFSGSERFGNLADVAPELGDQLRVHAFLLLAE